MKSHRKNGSREKAKNIFHCTLMSISEHFTKYLQKSSEKLFLKLRHVQVQYKNH